LACRSRVPFLLAALPLLAALATRELRAQVKPIKDEFTVQRFDPAPGPGNFLTTRGARTDGEMLFTAGAFANYAYKPFEVLSCTTRVDCTAPNPVLTDVPVIRHLVSLDLMGSLTVIPRVQVGLRLPLTWVKGQGITAQGGPKPGGLSAVALGDAELEGKARLYGEPTDTYVVGAAVFVTGPFGTLTARDQYVGDNTPGVGLRGIFDGKQDALSFGANLGGVLRGSGRVGTTKVGTEFRYGVAAGYSVNPEWRVIADFFGSTRFTSHRGENALEGDAGAEWKPGHSPFVISMGAGSGIIEGVGVPLLRIFVGGTYRFGQIQDQDDDGIADEKDQCKTQAEDKDGFEDNDGCPDPDNDGDTIKDVADKCPLKAEDFDGFEDLDGCPEDDNDKDGIVDTSDRCPLQPETFNGFEDKDGCPDEVDTDHDGVPDSRDKCVNEPEDTDGFEDLDGCPDPDNDKDGIPDQQDECSDEPETVNGYQDQDGCPDQVPTLDLDAVPPKP
jgi:hypothetical protein